MTSESMIYLIDYLANHPDYIEEVAQLKFNHWHHTSPDRPWEVWLSEIRESANADSPPMTLVALYETGAENRDLAGFVTLIQIEENAGIQQSLWMITLYVEEKYRNLGIGTHLMQRAITERKRLGYSALYLWTENKNLTSFYAKKGWQVVGRDDDSNEDIMVHAEALKK